MQQDQMVQAHTENSNAQQRKNPAKPVVSPDSGSNWQLKVLMLVIGLGVLMLILKAVGVV